MIYDLEERMSLFSENIISLIKTLRINSINKNCIDQLLRSSTSVGANYMEANHASSAKDFRNKIYISRKEANETKYWLRLLSGIEKEHIQTIRKLWKEAHELTLILVSISIKLNKK